MLKIILGAVIGGSIGYLGGPIWIFAGAGIGALSGFIVNMELALVSAMFKAIRYLILFILTFAGINWLVWKFFHVSIWETIQSHILMSAHSKGK